MELVKGTVTYFPCDQWLDKDEGDDQMRRKLMATKKSTDKRKGMLGLKLICLKNLALFHISGGPRY